MDTDQESLQFWSSILHSLSGTCPNDDLCADISNPLMVMSTSMATYASPPQPSNAPPPQPSNAPPPQPSNAPVDGDKIERGKAIATAGDMDINEGDKRRSTGKEIEVEKKEGAKEETKSLGKRPRSNEARNIAEKRRRTDIKNKLENLKQLTPNCKKRDTVSALECIVDNIRSMKLYVKSQSMGPMLPLGMKMDFPAPWIPFFPHNFIMPPYNGYIPGETSGANQQIGPVTTTTKGFNNQPHSSNSM